MKISYAITVCNEEKEIKQLIDFLLRHKRSEDEICVLVDKPKAGLFLLDVLYKYSSNDHILLKESAFQGNFSEWKNELNRMCKGDYIFNIDADEVPDDSILANISTITASNADLVFIPRVNTVVGITQEHIEKWKWHKNEKGYINFPDYQGRLYKNDSNIKWVGKVHERIEGHLTYTSLPKNDPPYFCLHHVKGIDRQEQQNELYEQL